MATITSPTTRRNSQLATSPRKTDAGQDLTAAQLREQEEAQELARLQARNEALAALTGQCDALYSAWEHLLSAGQYVAAKLVQAQLWATQAQVLGTTKHGAAA